MDDVRLRYRSHSNKVQEQAWSPSCRLPEMLITRPWQPTHETVARNIGNQQKHRGIHREDQRTIIMYMRWRRKWPIQSAHNALQAPIQFRGCIVRSAWAQRPNGRARIWKLIDSAGNRSNQPVALSTHPYPYIRRLVHRKTTTPIMLHRRPPRGTKVFGRSGTELVWPLHPLIGHHRR